MTETLPLAAAMRDAALPAAAQVRDADLPDSPTVYRVGGRVASAPTTPAAELGAAARDTAHHLIHSRAVDDPTLLARRRRTDRAEALTAATLLTGVIAWTVLWLTGQDTPAVLWLAAVVLVLALDTARMRRGGLAEQRAADVLAARLLDRIGLEGRVLMVAAIDQPYTPLHWLGGRASTRTRLDNLMGAYS